MYILGISAFYHDSAACIIKNEDILAAAQEERFTRKKHDSSFPYQAVCYCLDEANITLNEIDYICFYDKPFLKFERLIETYLSEAPRGFNSFRSAIPAWIKEKLFLKKKLVDELIEVMQLKKQEIHNKSTLKKLLGSKLLFSEHHLSHAASSFFPSPFDEAAILTMDGVGEWVTCSIAHGKSNQIKFLKEIRFPHSIGLLYSAFTSYLGFKINSGEYKVMGLAPYGEPKYTQLIKDHLIDIKEDGSFKLNMKYFNYLVGLSMTTKKFHDLFGRQPRNAESELTQFDMDVSRSIQDITEEIMLKLACTAKKLTGSENLVMAGGVALNCVGNGKILKSDIFKAVWIQPAAGDAGGSLGAAQAAYYVHLNNPRSKSYSKIDRMNGAYLGKQFDSSEIRSALDQLGAKYQEYSFDKIYDVVSDMLIDHKVIGWHQGKMEFGPRALGSRSILADPRSPKMQSNLNLKIKFRESFRPFASAVLRDRLTEYFEIPDIDSPYMLLVAPVQKNLRKFTSKEEDAFFGIDKLKVVRSSIPAVTHIDYSSRIQTVHEETNPKLYNLIKAFEKKTNYGVLINTSFNVRGEPIVCSPKDSFLCFMRTEMDLLVIENFVLYKNEQQHFKDDIDWKNKFLLD